MDSIAKCIVCSYFTKVYNWKIHRVKNTNYVKCPSCGEIIKCPWWLKNNE